jgi:hypothetical protein
MSTSLMMRQSAHALRPIVGLGLRPAVMSVRCISGTTQRQKTLYESDIPPSKGPSTALKPGVRQREEAQHVKVVGSEAKGSEGPHPHGVLQDL